MNSKTRIVLYIILTIGSLLVPVSGLYKGEEKVGQIYIFNLYQYALNGDIIFPLFLLLHFILLTILFYLVVVRSIRRHRN